MTDHERIVALERQMATLHLGIAVALFVGGGVAAVVLGWWIGGAGW